MRGREASESKLFHISHLLGYDWHEISGDQSLEEAKYADSIRDFCLEAFERKLKHGLYAILSDGTEYSFLFWVRSNVDRYLARRKARSGDVNWE